jgi:hypothetical protein
VFGGGEVTDKPSGIIEGSFNNLKGYPNPFKPDKAGGKSFKIINIPVDTSMEIFMADGSLVKKLNESDFGNTGLITWDGTDEAGNVVSNGIYIFAVKAPDGSRRTGKIALLK